MLTIELQGIRAQMNNVYDKKNPGSIYLLFWTNCFQLPILSPAAVDSYICISYTRLLLLLRYHNTIKDRAVSLIITVVVYSN